MQNIRGRIRWIWEGRYLYLILIFILISIILIVKKVDIGYNPDNYIRIYGLLLQLVGTFTIVISLKKKLIIFEGYGLGKFIINYFRRYPGKKKVKKSGMKAETGVLLMTTSEIREINRPKEDIKDVIRYYDEEIVYLHNRLNKEKKKLENDIRTLRTDLGILDRVTDNKLKETRQLISNASVSTVWSDLFGVTLLLLGLFLEFF